MLYVSLGGLAWRFVRISSRKMILIPAESTLCTFLGKQDVCVCVCVSVPAGFSSSPLRPVPQFESC